MEDLPHISALMARGRAFFQGQIPIICGGMTWVSEPHLVAAVSNAGAFACLAGGSAPADVLEQQITETISLTDRPFGVNLITVSQNYHDQLAMLSHLEKPVPYVFLAGGLPRDKEIAEAKATGAKVLCFASTESLAERMIRGGADALILEGCEAGGHIGQVSTTLLVQQILAKFAQRIPIFVAGGIATGQMAAHILLYGAAGIQMGTRFVMTEECRVHPNFKTCFAHANARDAMPTAQFSPRLPVIPVRAIKNQGTIAFEQLQLDVLKAMDAGIMTRQEGQAQLEAFWMGALRNAAVDGDVERGSVMAGQSVGLVSQVIPVKELIYEILNDGEAELNRIASLLTAPN